MALRFQIELEIGNVGFLRRGENRSTRRKTSGSKDENQQETQPTYDAESGNRTRVTWVGCESSYHCSITVPQAHEWSNSQFTVWTEVSKQALSLQRCYIKQNSTDTNLCRPVLVGEPINFLLYFQSFRKLPLSCEP